MGVSYSTALKNFRMSAVGVFIDSGAAAGRLELSTAGLGTLLATITLQKPSISGSASLGIIVFAGFPKTGTGVANGTLGGAQIKDSSGSIVIDQLSISTANAEIIVDNTSIVINQLVVISSIQITHG